MTTSPEITEPDTTDHVQEDTMSTTVTQHAAPARSDVTATARPTRPFVTHGRMLSAGAAAWALTIFAFSPNPHETVPLALYGIGSGAFQIGVLALLRVLYRTNALGEGRLARFVLRMEAVFLSLAICSTFVDAIQVSDLTQPGWLLLDAFWPISMLGMFLIGVRIAIAGRWNGVTRFYPMVAESWAVVTVPTMGIFGMGAATVVGGLHLLLGYTVLGVLVSRKEA
ncbi:MAG TPA: hypothetical protein VFJ28_01225 [Marmoricola sp.]|nr:hypothetical protein [Marmoricola sp.]